MVTAIIILSAALAVFNITLLIRLAVSEKNGREKETTGKEEVSVMGRTRTQPSFPGKQDSVPAAPPETWNAACPTEMPGDGSMETGGEFHPETDVVDDGEVEMEELFAVTGDDIRLHGTELVSDEIARLQRIHTQEDISREDKAVIQSTVSKLAGSEFLKLLRENVEKAERRNLELMRMIEAEEDTSATARVPASCLPAGADGISLEDFL